MLEELAVKNFAIIDDVRIRFGPGLSVLTGETGAGKSVLIQAVNLLLGGRASAQLVRSGAEAAELEAWFSVDPASQTAHTMIDHGFDLEDGLLVRRIVSTRNRHRIYVNDRLTTRHVLTDITANLASVSGQHAHQQLLREDVHLQMLDRYGDTLTLRQRVQAAHRALIPLKHRLEELHDRRRTRGAEHDTLRHRLEEIRSLAPAPDEDARLDAEVRRLRHAARLRRTVGAAVDGLYAGQGAVVERLVGLEKELRALSDADPSLTAQAERMAQAGLNLEDVAHSLQECLRGYDLDEGRLEEVEARLDRLNRLKRKYGGDIAAVLAQAADIEDQMAALDNLDQEIARLDGQLEAQAADLGRLGERLTRRRKAAARKLARDTTDQLAALNMSRSQFDVVLAPVTADGRQRTVACGSGRLVTDSGCEQARFMIAPNVGEAAKPLADIASGGELSRVVLALKTIMTHSEAVATVIFDEVDAGIGGPTADIVGRMLARLARRHQVLCITHLPQIARFGDQHLRIAKHVARERTHTTIVRLDADQRVEELARMLGGVRVTATTRAHARELLSSAAPSAD